MRIALRRSPVPRGEPVADELVRLGDVGRGRREPGADRPDRLVGDHEVCAGRAVRQRAVELAAEHVERLAAFPLGARLADADDGRQNRRATRPAPWRAPRRRFPCGRSAARNGRRSRPWRPASASISAEMSPVNAPEGSAWQSWPPIAILRAARLGGKGRDQGRRRADHQVGLGPASAPAPGHDPVRVRRPRPKPVHLPIARDQRAALRCGHPSPLFSSRNRADKPDARGALALSAISCEAIGWASIFRRNRP